MPSCIKVNLSALEHDVIHFISEKIILEEKNENSITSWAKS